MKFVTLIIRKGRGGKNEKSKILMHEIYIPKTHPTITAALFFTYNLYRILHAPFRNDKVVPIFS